MRKRVSVRTYRSKYIVMECEEAGKCAYIAHGFVAFVPSLTEI